MSELIVMHHQRKKQQRKNQRHSPWRTLGSRFGLGFLSSALLFSISSKNAFAAQPEMTLTQKVTHLLDRLSYGPRPGDIEKLVKQGPSGITKWVAAQLHPESISDSSLDEKLALLKSPTMTSAQLIAAYPRAEEIAEKMGIKKEDFNKGSDDVKKKIRAQIGEEHLPEQIVREMTATRLIRAVESRRQLQEVLTDFWLNHFNIDVTKGLEKWLLPEFEREVIRKHIFGKFSDLLRATAHSPAMLFYLDNQASRNDGLNENYAREIMELHTLGVDGGYTQSDVTQLARILTGWSIEEPRIDPVFKFRERIHDRGEKTFLGQKFQVGHGIDEGERAIDMLAENPATARFISTKLARYFVSDQPPKSLVDRMAQKFKATSGDLRAVYVTLFNSPEFWSKSAYHAKVKKPVQFIVSSIRALGGEIEPKNEVPRYLTEMGEELYKCPPPTGYKDQASVWINPGELVGRLAFATRLSLNRIEGVYVQLPRLDQVPDRSEQLVRLVSAKLMHDRLSSNSEKVVFREFENEHRIMADGEVRPFSLSKATALILGSPEFQRR
jgi:uncharacterized protein (DUF1800 family)